MSAGRDRELDARQVPWDLVAGSPGSAELVVFWGTGPLPLERVTLEETEDAVRIGLFESHPGVDDDGTPVAVAADSRPRAAARSRHGSRRKASRSLSHRR